MSEKRILITECSGECRYIRVVKGTVDMEDGYYCAACPHSGWERIDPKQCENCTREKHLTGKTREEVLDIMSKAVYYHLHDNNPPCSWEDFKKLESVGYSLFLEEAEVSLDAILEGNK